MRIDRELLLSALAQPEDTFERDWMRDKSPAPASVLVAVDADASVIAVLRARTVREHAGEVAFPGGKVDAADVDMLHTALREADEEIGLAPGDVEFLGRLSPIPVITGRYLIHPHVAIAREGARPRVASVAEIAAVLHVPLVPLLTGERRYEAVAATHAGRPYTIPHFPLGESHTMYGASAFILYDLLRRLALAQNIPLPPPVLRTDLPWGDRYENRGLPPST